jgi:hypothetical protein
MSNKFRQHQTKTEMTRHVSARTVYAIVLAVLIAVGAGLTLAACASHSPKSSHLPNSIESGTKQPAPELVSRTFTVLVDYLYPQFKDMLGVAGVPVGTTLVVSSNEGEYGLGAEIDSTTITLSDPPNSSRAGWLPGESDAPVWQVSVTLKVPADHATYAPYGGPVGSPNTWSLLAKPKTALPSGRDTLYMDPPTKPGGPWVVH